MLKFINALTRYWNGRQNVQATPRNPARPNPVGAISPTPAGVSATGEGRNSSRGRSDLMTIGPSADKAVVVGPRAVKEITIGPGVLVTTDSNRPMWEEKGWQQTIEQGSAAYAGHYAVLDELHKNWRRFQGVVVMEAGIAQPYIEDPPPEIRHHPKGPCFMLCAGSTSWFKLHWNTPAQHVDEAILYVERVLYESFTL